VRAPERLALTVLVVGLVLATSIPLGWALMTPPADAGTLPPAVVTASPLPTPADAVPHVEPAADASAVARDSGDAEQESGATVDDEPRLATHSARPADLDAAPSAPPERLLVPSIGIKASVVPIGVEDDGEMEVPDDVRDVGWYRHGPAPGEPGATVIAGHVDSREQGAGAFFDLRKLEVGARVKVVDDAGRTRRYDVVARRTYDKSNLPTDELFSRAGPSQLVLITCGGDFDSAARSYRSNVVVYAQPSS
jgi:LPXTG-site transpeptidase (sortase) family protein